MARIAIIEEFPVFLIALIISVSLHELGNMVLFFIFEILPSPKSFIYFITFVPSEFLAITSTTNFSFSLEITFE